MKKTIKSEFQHISGWISEKNILIRAKQEVYCSTYIYP